MNFLQYKRTLDMGMTCFLVFAAGCSTPRLTQVSFSNELLKLEKMSGGRIGVSAFNTVSLMRAQHRANERFPFCSSFKVLPVAALLKKAAIDKNLLQERVRYTQKDVQDSGYTAVTSKNVQEGMTYSELGAAALLSDNLATNLIIKKLGGNSSVVSFARSLGDQEFRLDRWEPELNSAIPNDPRDTTTPSAMEKTLYQVTLGQALPQIQREQLQTWMKANTTGGNRIRAGVPPEWTVGDKTGTCGAYGTTNDIGMILPPQGAPIVLVVYYTHPEKSSSPREDIIATVTQLVLNELKETR